MRFGACFLWAGFVFCVAAPAAAQSASFIVVGAHHAALSNDAVPVDAVEQGIRLGGATPLAGGEARTRFIASHSDEPAVITPSDVAALERCYHEAGMSLARGRVQTAGEQVQRCIDRANELRETLVRDASGAQSFLRACAVQVQFYVSSGRGDDALRQATECRLVASDVPLSARSAPPEVRAIFEAADHALANLETATIEVRSAPHPGCAVWLRGQNVGTTPAVVPGLWPGRADLQVECTTGHAGRVHRLNFNAGRNLITIDTRFEDVVRTEGRLRLVYSEPADVEAHRVEDAVTIGRATQVSDVLLVTLDGERAAAVLERVDVQRGAVRARAVVTLRDGHLDEEEFAAARVTLENAPRPVQAVGRPVAAGTTGGAATQRVAARVPQTPAPAHVVPRGAAGDAAPAHTIAPAQRDRGRGARIFTWLALGAGVAALAGGIIVGGIAQADYDDLARRCATPGGCTDSEIDAEDLGTRSTIANILFAVGGAALVTGAVLFFVEGGTGPADPQVTAGIGLGGLVAGGRF